MANETSVKDMTRKLTKFEGQDLRRWQKKIHFLLTTLRVAYVLSTPMLEVVGDEPPEATRRRSKWENDDYIWHGHILNGMYDYLFDIYQNVESAKELLDSLESKYMTEDASTISVAVIIDKLPPSWKDFKHTLKHKKEELTLVKLGSHLRIEESLKTEELDNNPKGMNQVGSSSVNMVEGEGSKNSNKFKGKMKFKGKDDKYSNKKAKLVCWGCKKLGHLNKDCHLRKVNKDKDNYVNMISKAFYVQDGDVAWWLDSGATSHVCKDLRWFKDYQPIEDGPVVKMGNVDTELIKGLGSVLLNFTSGNIHIIIHQTTAPYTPKQNGIAERKNKTLKEMVNFMLSSSGLSEGFWGEAMLIAHYILNRTPSKRSKATPYELWHKKVPNLSYLKVWGCRAVVRLTDQKGKTWEKRVLKIPKLLRSSKFVFRERRPELGEELRAIRLRISDFRDQELLFDGLFGLVDDSDFLSIPQATVPPMSQPTITPVGNHASSVLTWGVLTRDVPRVHQHYQYQAGDLGYDDEDEGGCRIITSTTTSNGIEETRSVDGNTLAATVKSSATKQSARTKAARGEPETQTYFIKKMNEFMAASQQQTQANSKAIANMERQIAQLAEGQRKRDSGKLPSNTEVNQNHTQRAEKEHVNAVDSCIPEKVWRNVTVEDLMGTENKDEEAPEESRILKEMCKEKEKVKVHTPEKVRLRVKASEDLLGTFPKKEKDPGSPYNTVTVGDVIIRNTLLDLGANVNILPGYLYDKYKNEELEPAKTVLQLADQSTKVSRGKLTNVIVKVGDFFYLVDFLVMEYESLEDAPTLILGRPFLATAGAVMDCKKGDLDITFGKRKRRQNMFGCQMTLPLGYDNQYMNGRPLIIPRTDRRSRKNENRDNEGEDKEILWNAKRHPLASVDKLQLLEMIEMMVKRHQAYAKDARNRESKVFHILDAQQQRINQVSDRMTQLTTLMATILHDVAPEIGKLVSKKE
ncbi:hypothetical protein L1887_15017 [Cichorium endivia]|nr:hypothetical protein L1887_15017 [Cichorium endivia]